METKDPRHQRILLGSGRAGEEREKVGNKEIVIMSERNLNNEASESE